MLRLVTAVSPSDAAVPDGEPRSSAAESGGADGAAEAGKTESADAGWTADHHDSLSTDPGQGNTSTLYQGYKPF